MNVFSLFAAAVFAAESIISPIPDNTPVVVPPPAQPEISFGEIVSPPVVLGTETEATPSPTPTAPPVIQTKKKSYTIAFLGDSMIDTMGPDLPAVKHRLENMYRSTTFTLLNYGAGGTNIEYGIERITSGYTYLGNTIPSLASTHPDIVVVESFGYNPRCRRGHTPLACPCQSSGYAPRIHSRGKNSNSGYDSAQCKRIWRRRPVMECTAKTRKGYGNKCVY